MDLSVLALVILSGFRQSKILDIDIGLHSNLSEIPHSVPVPRSTVSSNNSLDVPIVVIYNQKSRSRNALPVLLYGLQFSRYLLLLLAERPDLCVPASSSDVGRSMSLSYMVESAWIWRYPLLGFSFLFEDRTLRQDSWIPCLPSVPLARC
jgi:hypothetical protein